MSNVLRFPDVPRCVADIDFDHNPPTRAKNLTLRHTPAILENGVVVACDRWTFFGEEGHRFHLVAEGYGWVGYVARPDGSFLRTEPRRANATLAETDPDHPFSPFNGVDRVRPRAGAPWAADVGSSYEHLVLNSMKTEVTHHRAHEITTGPDAKEQAR